ncbi:MAG: hypothetical protein ACI9EF_000938 [Pseudohongiellaceae bacterium]|jgi:hypothetical protein
MMLRSKIRPVALALSTLAALCTALSGQGQAQVEVHSDFDLAGWSRNGVVTVTSAELPDLWMDRLIDGSRRTVVAVEGHSVVKLNFEFDPPQYVRKVGLRPGGNSEYEVILAAVKADGSRFAFGQKVVSDGDEALFRPVDAMISRVELTIENLQVDPEIESVEIAEVRMGGLLSVLSLSLQSVPERLPKGGLFPVRILGQDSFGGRPDLTLLCQLAVTPRRALKERTRGRLEARIAGAISIAPHLDSLQGETRHFMVNDLEPPPAPPQSYKGFGAIELALSGQPPFEIFRREQGEKEGRSLGAAWSQRFIDEAIDPGTAYLYTVRQLDRFGNPTTEVSDETRVRTLTRPAFGEVDIGRLPVLVLLYADSMAEGEPERIVQSLERARTFFFVHSGGRLLIDNTYLWMNGPTPDTRGPTMDAINTQLELYELPADAFGVIYAVANDLSGAHGNFELLGGMGGAMGREPGVATPPGALGPDPDVAWVFLHELNHVLAGRIANTVGRQNLASGDLAQDFRFGPLGSSRGQPRDLGDGWDGLAALTHDSAFWDDVGSPFRRPLELIDSDGDGLPDSDPRVPVDESRFGSDPQLSDSDGDGLTDRDELRAGLYSPSDPQQVDSDGDGIPDGQDPWPLSNFTGKIPYGDTPAVLATGPRSRQASSEMTLAACWTEDALTLRITTPLPSDVFIDLDGSGALGRWESDVIVSVDGGLTSGSDVWAGPARLTLRGHEKPLGVFIGERLLTGVTPVVEQISGRSQLTVRLPVALGPGALDASSLPGAPTTSGLRLVPGTVLGLALTVRPARAGGSPPFDAFQAAVEPGKEALNLAAPALPWMSLFETHRLHDAVLLGPETSEN